MATDVLFTRRTRSASRSPCVTPIRSPRVLRTAESDKPQRVNRRVLYPSDDESDSSTHASPMKRARRSTTESPKKLSTMSFYGGSKGPYLNPLERKHLAEVRLKTLSPEAQVCEEANTVSPEPCPAPKRARTSSRGRNRSGTSRKSPAVPSNLKSPLQEIIPIKNTPETVVDSPSRKGRKFFKSKRKVNTCSQPAIVMKKGLTVKYQPKGVTVKGKDINPQPILTDLPKTLGKNEKPFEGKPSLRLRNLPSPVVRDTIASSIAATRTSPRSAAKRLVRAGTPSNLINKVGAPKLRTPIHSSKNPNSQELFSVSDWDLDEESANEAALVRADTTAESSELDISADIMDRFIDSGNVSGKFSQGTDGSQQTDTNDAASICSTLGDSVLLLSDTSGSQSPLSIAEKDRQDDTESNCASVSSSTQAKVFSIFTTRNNRSPQIDDSPSSSSGKKRWQFRSSSQKSKIHTLVEKDGREQMTLDFGQKLKGAVECPTCGMTYVLGDPDDETLHKKFHRKLLAALEFRGWKKEHVLHKFEDGSRILVVIPDEKLPMKKVMAVKMIVDEDLGFVVESSGIKQNSKVFLYVSEDKRVVGFCVAEVIKKAHRVIRKADQGKVDTWNSGEGTQPLCCSTKAERALCGINRIWVLGSERRRKIASKMLDCIRENFIFGYPLAKADLAFTDPTPNGQSFSANYVGTETFLVYKHSP